MIPPKRFNIFHPDWGMLRIIEWVVAVRFPTSAMESLWNGQGLIRESWGAVPGVGGCWRCSQEIHGTSFSHYLVVPHTMGILS